MIRKIVAAGLGSLMLASLPAVGQEVSAQDMPELDGAPPPLKIPAAKPKPKAVPPKAATAKPAPAKPTPAKQTQVKPEAAKPKPAQAVAADNAKVALPMDDKLKAAQSQLARQAAELKAQQDGLEARAADLKAREQGIADREAQLAAQQAELAKQRDDLARQVAAKTVVADADKPDAHTYSKPGLDRVRAVQACARAGQDEARERNFYSAKYQEEPIVSFGRVWKVRGLMRLDDRGGYMIVDTVCEVDEDGEAQRITFLR